MKRDVVRYVSFCDITLPFAYEQDPLCCFSTANHATPHGLLPATLKLFGF